MHLVRLATPGIRGHGGWSGCLYTCQKYTKPPSVLWHRREVLQRVAGLGGFVIVLSWTNE